MSKELTIIDSTDLVRGGGDLAAIGQAANVAAAGQVIAEYRSRKSANTRRAQDSDLVLWARYLASAGVAVGDPLLAESWRGCTGGLVAGFRAWLLAESYAVAALNRALATVRRYAGLAAAAGQVDAAELVRIQLVHGYSAKEASRIGAGQQERRGHKKASATSIDAAQAAALKTAQDSTPQAARDALLMYILLDHGLRVSEVALLRWQDIDLSCEYLTFYRPKVDKTQRIRLSKATRAALLAYRAHIDVYIGALLLASDKRGQLKPGSAMCESAINQRVAQLGQRCGVARLSPHDCRHHLATLLARKNVPMKAFQDAGGWSSPAMPLRYAESAEIANEGAEVD